MYTIVGLGNVGSEYEETRHNTGALALKLLEKRELKAKLVYPSTFMNKTGSAVGKLIKNKKQAEKLVVIYDDLDLPLGEMKISWNRGSGGHKGLESIIKAIKTREFIRIRIGIGNLPAGRQGKNDVEKHILGKFTPREKEILKKVFKKTADAVEMIIAEGLPKAQTLFN